MNDSAKKSVSVSAPASVAGVVLLLSIFSALCGHGYEGQAGGSAFSIRCAAQQDTAEEGP